MKYLKFYVMWDSIILELWMHVVIVICEKELSWVWNLLAEEGAHMWGHSSKSEGERQRECYRRSSDCYNEKGHQFLFLYSGPWWPLACRICWSFVFHSTTGKHFSILTTFLFTHIFLFHLYKLQWNKSLTSF